MTTATKMARGGCRGIVHYIAVTSPDLRQGKFEEQARESGNYFKLLVFLQRAESAWHFAQLL